MVAGGGDRVLGTKYWVRGTGYWVRRTQVESGLLVIRPLD